jgi:hypothetical protein
VENLSLDLNLKENCERAARDAYQVYDFAGIAHFVGSYKKGPAPPIDLVPMFGGRALQKRLFIVSEADPDSWAGHGEYSFRP